MAASGSDDRPGPVLVTGANGGIGLATTVRLAERGWSVWGTVRSPAAAAGLRRALRAARVGPRVRVVVLDVSDHAAVVTRWRRLPDFWAVVNNAGGVVSGAVEEVPAAEAMALLGVNLVTPAVISGCALPGMRRLGGGRIVMVSSMAGRVAPLPFQAWYHASKFGLEALSEVLRLEVAQFGVRVSVVEPGFVRTGIEGKAAAELRRRAGSGSPYAAGYARVERLTGLVERHAPAPDAVARAIVAAVEGRRPRRRYLVGSEAPLLPAAALLPDEVTDLAIRLVADLRGGPPARVR